MLFVHDAAFVVLFLCCIITSVYKLYYVDDVDKSNYKSQHFLML